MLIDFEVINFRSFKDDVVFSMETGAYLKKYNDSHVRTINKTISVLKSAYIFGPNANGKTNVLNGLAYLKMLVMRPTMSDRELLPTDTFAHGSEPTVFQVRFSKNDAVYMYRVEYNQREVLFEILEKDDEVIFKRRGLEFDVLPDALRVLKDTFRRNQLLLFLAQSYQNPIAQTAFEWFSDDLILITPVQFFAPNVVEPIFQSKENQERLLNFIQAADFGIEKMEIIKRLQKPSVVLRINEESGVFEHLRGDEIEPEPTYELLLTHKSAQGEFKLPISDESEGTQAFVSLAIQIFNDTIAGKTILIDEFDKSLHFELVKALIAIFNHKQQRNQFIVTTHQLELMDSELRPDQIWFAEKDKYGASSLFSVFDFKIKGQKRSDFGFAKRYLKGQYGAMQIVNRDRLMFNLFGSDGETSGGRDGAKK